MTSTDSNDAVREQVRDRYASAALAVLGGEGASCGTDSAAGCCAPAADAFQNLGLDFGAELYGAAERAELPAAAVAASLGCGNPLAVADLREGETVLDLGSGGGIDVILSARRVGVTGKAYGVDMTDEMLTLARTNADAAGVTNVEFLKGTIETLPVADASIDVVISNCVINLSTDKPAVFAEMSRVLRPGGRVGVSDVVADDRLAPAERAERGDFSGCIAGALSVSEYTAGLHAAGFADVSVTFTHEVADGLHGAIVRARKPVGGAPEAAAAADAAPPVAAASCCPPVVQTSCCEPSAKASCCTSDAAASGGCGCR
jgi:SAM-dependent methyltransferase